MHVERTIDDIEQIEEMFEAEISGHSAQATSLRPIKGTTKWSRTAHGSSCGSGMAFVAAQSLPNSD
jgi:hypothetical protein